MLHSAAADVPHLDATGAEVTTQVPATDEQRGRRVLHLATIHQNLGLVGLGAARDIPVTEGARVPEHNSSTMLLLYLHLPTSQSAAHCCEASGSPRN